MYRRHFKEWIERSLYTFHDDDAFTPAFSYAAGTAGNFESPAYAALGKTPHTHGGYRLYSARATLAYSAPYIVINEAAAAANAFNPLAGPNVHPLIDSESFTYLMDHTHDPGRRPALGTNVYRELHALGGARRGHRTEPSAGCGNSPSGVRCRFALHGSFDRH